MAVAEVVEVEAAAPLLVRQAHSKQVQALQAEAEAEEAVGVAALRQAQALQAEVEVAAEVEEAVEAAAHFRAAVAGRLYLHRQHLHQGSLRPIQMSIPR